MEVSYGLPNSPLTKRLWKIAIENHTFFQYVLYTYVLVILYKVISDLLDKTNCTNSLKILKYAEKNPHVAGFLWSLQALKSLIPQKNYYNHSR